MRRAAFSGLLCLAFLAQALFPAVAAHGPVMDCGGAGMAVSAAPQAHHGAMAHHDHAMGRQAGAAHEGHAMAHGPGDPAPNDPAEPCMNCDAMAACGGLLAILEGPQPLRRPGGAEHDDLSASRGAGLVASACDRPPRLI